ncbi:MAG: hypothetical protein AMXMBFR80_23100 [Dehalococcoidia bacterium]
MKNSDATAPLAAKAKQRPASPARDYPAEPVRSQWVVDLASHRVVRRAARSPRPTHGDPAAS